MNNLTTKQLKKQLIKYEEDMREIHNVNKVMVKEYQKLKERIISLRYENQKLKETIEELQR